MAPESSKRKADGFGDDSHSERTTKGSRRSINEGATESAGAQSESKVANQEEVKQHQTALRLLMILRPTQEERESMAIRSLSG